MTLPHLERCLRAAVPKLAEKAELAEQRLYELGETTSGFRLEGLVRAAEVVNIAQPFQVQTLRSVRVVIKRGMRKRFLFIARAALDAVRRRGAASVDDLVDATKSAPLVIQDLLSVLPRLEWLDESRAWFWFHPVFPTRPSRVRNRLVNQISKVLAVAESIHISELRSGVARHRRMRGLAPPRPILLGICRRIPWCIVQGETVSRVGAGWKEFLDGMREGLLAKAVASAGGVVTRDQMEEAGRSVGFSLSSVNVLWGNSPLFDRVRSGVVRLRGMTVAPGMLENISSSRVQLQVARDYGWTGDGKIWIATSLSHRILSDGRVYVPAGVRRFLGASYQLWDHGEWSAGELKLADGHICGVRQYLVRRGAEVGDWLLAIFDLPRRGVNLYLGDEDLLEDLRATDANGEHEEVVEESPGG